ncbi:MAG: prepilin-type N-terminal cleavage/methylation domain-containing protein [Candidatus Saccharimonas sp.]
MSNTYHYHHPIHSKQTYYSNNHGFTIVELLIVIVVIAILAAISIVAYNGIQDRAKNIRVQSDIKQVATLIEMYYTQEGTYPSTGSLSNVYSDANCTFAADSDGAKTKQWVPGITETLPQNPGLVGTGVSALGGCYLYSSNGTEYILSAWNAKRGGSSTDAMYRRIGFREPWFYSDNRNTCNSNWIGTGNGTGSPYVLAKDYYKNSYTISNITNCNETPPSGA